MARISAQSCAAAEVEIGRDALHPEGLVSPRRFAGGTISRIADGAESAGRHTITDQAGVNREVDFIRPQRDALGKPGDRISIAVNVSVGPLVLEGEMIAAGSDELNQVVPREQIPKKVLSTGISIGGLQHDLVGAVEPAHGN